MLSCIRKRGPADVALLGWVERETVIEVLVWTGGLRQNTSAAEAILQHRHEPHIHRPQSCRAPAAGAPSTAGS